MEFTIKDLDLFDKLSRSLFIHSRSGRVASMIYGIVWEDQRICTKHFL